MTATTEPTTHICDITSSHLPVAAEMMDGWFENDASAVAAAITDMMAASGGDEDMLRTVRSLRQGAEATTSPVDVLKVAGVQSRLKELSLAALDRTLGYDGQSGLARFEQALQNTLKTHFEEQSKWRYASGVNCFKIATDYSSWTRNEMFDVARAMANKDNPRSQQVIEKIEAARGDFPVIVAAYLKAFRANPANSNGDVEELRRKYRHGLASLAELIPEKSAITLEPDGRVVHRQFNYENTITVLATPRSDRMITALTDGVEGLDAQLDALEKNLRMARTAFTVLSESLVTPEEQIQGKIAYQNLRDAQDARNAFTADQSAY